jgi:hypothetical protein
MKVEPKTSIDVYDEFIVLPIPEKIREELMSNARADLNVSRSLTPEQRKKEASKPLYLLRYE